MSTHPITDWRKAEGLSQEDAAIRLGVSRWTITRMETGDYVPSWKLAKCLHEATGISLKRLRPDIFADAVASERGAA